MNTYVNNMSDTEGKGEQKEFPQVRLWMWPAACTCYIAQGQNGPYLSLWTASSIEKTEAGVCKTEALMEQNTTQCFLENSSVPPAIKAKV